MVDLTRLRLAVCAAVLVLSACGSQSYREGDDDRDTSNPCAETQASRPESCEN